MVAVFAGALVLGVVGLGWWIVAEKARADRAGAVTIRRLLAALLAFGMGGMSASFAGLNDAVAAVLAVVAAAALVVYSESVTG